MINAAILTQVVVKNQETFCGPNDARRTQNRVRRSEPSEAETTNQKVKDGKLLGRKTSSLAKLNHPWVRNAWLELINGALNCNRGRATAYRIVILAKDFV